VLIRFIRLAVVASKSTKSREISRRFELIAIQGHRFWCQSKAHMQIPVSHL